MKPYCIKNNDNCKSCSLIKENGKDCFNNPLDCTYSVNKENIEIAKCNFCAGRELDTEKDGVSMMKQARLEIKKTRYNTKSYLVDNATNEFICLCDLGTNDEEVDWELVEQQANEQGYELIV